MPARFRPTSPSRPERLTPAGRWLSFWLLVGGLLFVPLAGAWAEDVRLLLAVELNGALLGQVVDVVQRDDALLLTGDDLAAIGLRLVETARSQDGMVRLDRLPGVRVRVNERAQMLMLRAEPRALRPGAWGEEGRVLPPVSPPLAGLTMNYDAAGLDTNGQGTGSALLGSRLFGVYGTLASNAIVQTPQPGLQSAVRLDTYWTDVDPTSLRRVLVGDTITGGLSWTRQVRLGGAQISTDFGLQPQMVSYPLPTVTGQAAVPSSADLLINGIRQYSGQVSTGPFEYRQAPVLTGAGDMQVVLRDAAGHETVTSSSIYVSTALLREGLAAYSLEAGGIRRDYGLRSDHYGPGAAAGTFRYGVTNWLTAESHAEAISGVGMGGGGMQVLVGHLGVVNLSAAGSGGRTSGVLGSVGFQRQAVPFSFGVDTTFASPGFRDIASVTGSPRVSSLWRASAGLSLGSWGSLAGTWMAQRGSATASSQAEMALYSSLRNVLVIAPTYSAVTATWSRPIGERLTVMATAYATLSGPRSAGGMLQLVVPIGRTGSAAVGASGDNRSGPSGYAQYDRAARDPGEFGYRVYDQEGGTTRRSGSLEYESGSGWVTAGVDNAPGYSAGRVEARGSVTLAQSHLFASDWIDDSFAIVQSGDVPGVGVLVENRPAGRTDSSGRLLVPGLRAWDSNNLSLDPGDLPEDVEMTTARMKVVPSERAGVRADFGLRRSRSAVVVLVDPAGKLLAVGSDVRVNGRSESIVGYGGEAWLRELDPHNEAEVQIVGGASCRAAFDYAAEGGDIPRIGPLTCQ